MSQSMDRAALTLFERVFDLTTAEQHEFLDQHCDDPQLRRRVMAMLVVDASENGVLETPADQHLAGLLGAEFKEDMPDTIGHFRILKALGKGGMATVYLAERAEDDFQQTVALKLIMPSRLGEHWRERFLQERQILASLNHPNIAQLLDGGVSDDGRPFFALEYVDGLAITSYCDDQRLNISQRLELMLAVCDAVSYAHRNLIVHRDLKPSNIMVDSNGMAKLLDFGIAKLLGERDAFSTMTGHRAMTPDYAAPEQFVGEAVTTATDVYALGVLLFELLAGRRPYVSTTSSPLDIERQILNQNPPSFAALDGEFTQEQMLTIAAARRLSWSGLQRYLVGDLEKIVHKAIRKEPERRYPTAEALAEDLRRFLNGMPVQARANSRWYRIRKFVGRHQAGVAMSVLAGIGLMLSTGVAVQQAKQARAAAIEVRLEARRATETKDFLASLFEYASPDKSLGERVTARQLLDLGAKRITGQLHEEPQLRAELLQLLADTYLQLGLYEAARPLAEDAVVLRLEGGDPVATIGAILSMTRLLRATGDFEGAGHQLDQADRLPRNEVPDALLSAMLSERGELAREQAQFELAQQSLADALAIDQKRGALASDIARDIYRLALLQVTMGDNEEALILMENSAQTLESVAGDENTQYATIRHDLGVLLIQKGELDRANQVLHEVRSLREKLLGHEHPDLAVTIKELAGIARLQDRQADAEKLYLDALKINQEMLGSEHPETSNNLNSLAVFYRGRGENERALVYAKRALSGALSSYGDQHPTVGVMTMNIGNLQRMTGQLDAAEQTIEAALKIILAGVGAEHHLSGVALNARAGVAQALGKLEAAEVDYRQALLVFSAAAGEDHPHMLNIHTGLASLLIETGALEQALDHYEKAATVGEAALPAGHRSTRIAQFGIARVLALQGDCSAAESLSRQHISAEMATGSEYTRLFDLALSACKRRVSKTSAR